MAEPFAVAAGGDEELARGLVADAVSCDQVGGDVIALMWRDSSRASSSRDLHRRATVAVARLAAVSAVIAPFGSPPVERDNGFAREVRRDVRERSDRTYRRTSRTTRTAAGVPYPAEIVRGAGTFP